MSFLETSGIAVKTHTPDGPRDYRIGAGPFQVYRAPDRTLDSLIRTLSCVTSRVFYVRAEPVQSDALVITARNQQTLQDVPHPLIPIDFELPGPDTSDLRAVHALAVERLPDVFKGVTCYVQASASTGMPGKGARARLWFEGARSTTCAELKAWLKGCEGVDTSIYHVPQPIYVAPPIFVGVLDPCPERAYMHHGTRERVEVPVIDVAPVKVYGTNMRPPSAEMALDMLRKFYAVLSKALAEPLLSDGNMSKISGQFAYLGGLLWQLPVTEQDAAKAKAFDELERWHTQQIQNGYTRSWEDVLDRAQKSFEQGESKQKVPVDMVREVELQLGAGMMIAPLNLVQAAAAALNDLKGKRTKQAQAERIVLQSIVEPQHHAAPPEAVAELVARKWPGATPDQLATCVPSAVEYFAPALEHARQEATAAVRAEAEQSVARARYNGTDIPLEFNKAGKLLPEVSLLNSLIRLIYGDRLFLNVRTIEAHLNDKIIHNITQEALDFQGDIKRDLGTTFADELISSQLQKHAEVNEVDPWRDWLEALPPWDGTPRAESIFASCCGNPADEYHVQIARKFLLSVLARTFEPGVKQENVVCLISTNGGTRKTDFYNHLMPQDLNLVATTHSQGNTKDDRSTPHRFVLNVWDELSEFRKDAAERAELSTSFDVLRMPYSARARNMMRRFVYVATSNTPRYLPDGQQRRHWPVVVTSPVPLAWLDENKDQIWAEALTWRAAKEPHWFDMDWNERVLFPRQTEEHVRIDDEGFLQTDRVEGLLASLTSGRPEIASLPGVEWDANGQLRQISARALASFTTDWHTSAKATGKALRALGWLPRTYRDKDDRDVRVWRKE